MFGYICASVLFTLYGGLVSYLAYDARRNGRLSN